MRVLKRQLSKVVHRPDAQRSSVALGHGGRGLMSGSVMAIPNRGHALVEEESIAELGRALSRRPAASKAGHH